MARSLVFCVGMLLSGLFLLGCSCEGSSKKVSPAQNQKLAPLVSGVVPSSIRGEVHLAEGTTDPLPVVLVISRTPLTCRTVAKFVRKTAHVLCSDVRVSQQELPESMKEALKFVKVTHAPYIAPAPVHLVTDEALSDLGFDLMLSEPQVFSFAYLPLVSTRRISPSSLARLTDFQARTLIMTYPETSERQLLRRVAQRRGLGLHFLPPSPETLSQALALLRSSDSRWSSQSEQPSKHSAP